MMTARCPKCGAVASPRIDPIMVEHYGAGHVRAVLIMECRACGKLWSEPTIGCAVGTAGSVGW